MKKFLSGVGIVLILAALAHLFVWFMDRDLTAKLRVQNADNKLRVLTTVRDVRLPLEAKQKQEIKIYGRTENENVAQIPVERAIYYYLRSLPR